MTFAISFEKRLNAAERYALCKVGWSAPEYRALVDRYADAVQKFQVALAQENLRGIRLALHDLQDIVLQTTGLNDGIQHAIIEAYREARETGK